MKKRRAASLSASGTAQPSMMHAMHPMMPQMQHFMQPMIHPMMQPMIPAQQVSISSDSDDDAPSSSRKKSKKEGETDLANSASVLVKLPKVRLQEAIECMHESFDATQTANLDNEHLARIIWFLSRVRPDTKLRFLRVKSYKQFCLKLVTASERTQNKCGRHFLEMLDRLVELTPRNIVTVSNEAGFEEAWLKMGRSSKKKKRADSEEDPAQMSLNDCIEAKQAGTELVEATMCM